MNTHEEIAAAKRDELLDADLIGQRWHDIVLQPWNHNREALCLALIAADAHAPDLRQIDLIEMMLERQRVKMLATEQMTPEERRAIEQLTLSEMVTEAGFSWAPYFPAAAKTLWLAAHVPADWQHLRGPDLSAWLTEIDAWASKNIQPHELEAAVKLAHQLRTAHAALVTIPRPSGGPRKLGN